MAISRAASILISLFAALASGVSVALPPAGLTPIAGDNSSGLHPTIGVVNGVAYVTSQEGIYPIVENGVGELIVPENPFGGTVERLRFTRVSKSSNGAAHVAVGFAEDLFTPLGVASYNPADPSKPTNIWPDLFGALGLTAEGAIFGGGRVLHPDGSVTTYPVRRLKRSTSKLSTRPPAVKLSATL